MKSHQGRKGEVLVLAGGKWVTRWKNSRPGRSESHRKVSPREGHMGAFSRAVPASHRAWAIWGTGLPEAKGRWGTSVPASQRCAASMWTPSWLGELLSGWRVWAQKEKLPIAQLFWDALGAELSTPQELPQARLTKSQQSGGGEVLSSCLQIGKRGSESWNDLSTVRKW